MSDDSDDGESDDGAVMESTPEAHPGYEWQTGRLVIDAKAVVRADAAPEERAYRLVSAFKEKDPLKAEAQVANVDFQETSEYTED